MAASLLSHIGQKIVLHGALEEAIEGHFTRLIARKGELLLQEGQTCSKLYFIASGLVRTYYHLDGKDVTSWIYPEDTFVTSWFSFLREVPGFESIEVLETTELYSIPRDRLQHLYAHFPKFERFGRFMAEEQLTFIDYFSKGYMFLSAKERLDLLLSFYPDLMVRAKLGHIASLLGISQETLSRIRAPKHDKT